MKRRILIAFLTIVSALSLACFTTACFNRHNNVDDNELEYRLSADKKSYVVADVGSYKGESVVIPKEYKGKPVTEIGGSAFFMSNRITSIEIPNSIKRIGNYAFRYASNLATITIKEDSQLESIGIEAFQGCNLKTIYYNGDIDNWVEIEGLDTLMKSSITLYVNGVKPTNLVLDTATKISEKAFYNCDSLESVEILSSVTSIGSSAFRGCKSLESIKIPSSVTSIDSSAFSGCNNLVSITFGENSKIQSFGNNAFYNCDKLEYIEIPRSVTSIGSSAFYNCNKLGKVNFKGSIEDWCNIEINDSLANPLNNFADLYINDEKLTELIIPNTITEIKKYTFIACKSLISIKVEENSQLKSIDSYAFSWCVNLISVEIPSSITNIAAEAFRGCVKLVEVFNKSNLIITKGAYNHGCVGSYAKVVYNQIKEGSNLSFDNDYIVYTDGEDKILIGYLGTETHIVIPNYITKVYTNAFYKYTNLVSVEIPNTVTSIGNYAFWGCDNLVSITFGANSKIESFGNSTFEDCKSLESIKIPSSVTSIGHYAFWGCDNLASITFGENSKIESLGSYAFSGCKSLESIKIPSSVTRMGERAFEDCSNLKTIIFDGTKAEWYNMYKGSNWNLGVLATCVQCINGQVEF